MNKVDDIKTHVSKAYWYNEQNDAFEGACVCFGPCQNPKRGIDDKCQRHKCEANKYKPIAWLDQLFRGGIKLPKTQSGQSKSAKPLTVLIAGAPGSGKTTLCSEICYNLALMENGKHDSLYASTESESENIISNFESFGYQDAQFIFDDFNAKKPPLLNSGKVLIYGKERFENIQDKRAVFEKFKDCFKLAMTWFNPVLSSVNWDEIWGDANIQPLVGKRKHLKWPYVMVFDSLNVMPIDNASLYINKILKNASGIKAIFLILDVSPVHEDYKIWEHFCDVVIKLDYADIRGYYTRTIEIVKARYQSHIWGKHPFKIYRPLRAQDPEIQKRSHPYRKQGGIFIYPSIHFFLSEYKHMEPPSEHAMQKTLPKSLNKMLKKVKAETGGFPEGRCTAFVGERGGHKSHLAYLHLLNRVNEKESGLVISLRDDENMTRDTMNGIYRDFKEKTYVEDGAVQEMEKKGKLEILYFHPGYVTAEEFFHRVFIAVQKLKRKCKKITVLFNSLDQLSARFPLCAERDIFIPGLVNFLTAEQITSIFIAVPEEKGQPTEQYGLLPMADLILSFKRKKVKKDAYGKAVLEAYNDRHGKSKDEDVGLKNKIKDMEDRYIEEVILEVIRFSGGQRAGACGILELKDKGTTKLDEYYDRSGLHFTELSEVDWEYIPK